jgi:regulator of protease activity HflC (stomatin/prohibitin superfamily)
MRGLVRDVISGYRAEAVYSTSRGDIQRLISDQLSTRLAADGLQVTDFLIRNVTFSNEDFINSIEQVQIAERRAQEAEFRVQQEQQEAARVRVAAEGERDADITRAEGEAEAIRIRAAAEAEALSLVSEEIAKNPNLIQYEYVQKLAPNVGLILLPSNSPFLFDFNSLNNSIEQNGITLPQVTPPAP